MRDYYKNGNFKQGQENLVEYNTLVPIDTMKDFFWGF